MKISARVLIILSIVFGGTVGVLGVLRSPAVGIVAMIGGLVLGCLWVVRGLLARSPDRS